MSGEEKEESIVETSEELALEILDNMQRFLGTTWTGLSLKDISIHKISCGYCNTVYRVERAAAQHEAVEPGSSSSSSSPRRLLYRKYGGTQIGDFIRQQALVGSETAETLIFYESGRSGRAPLIYGIFAGGRIEEFIDGHTMSPDEMSDHEILSEAAAAFAAFHALRLPLPNAVPVFMDRLKQPTTPQEIDDIRTELSNTYPELDATFLDVDLSSEIAWILRTIPLIRSPIVLNHHDNNLLNVMVRDEVKEGQKKVMLIDYEMSRYMFRCYDLGWFFVNKTLQWNGKDTKMSGSAYPTPEERRVFLTAYAHEVSQQASHPSHGDEQSNSISQLMLEADFGAVMACAIMATRLRLSVLRLLAVERSFATLPPYFIRLYSVLKADFDQNHPQFQ